MNASRRPGLHLRFPPLTLHTPSTHALELALDQALLEALRRRSTLEELRGELEDLV
jgi:hypothetical protein